MASTQENATNVIDNAQATLSVKLINGDGEDPAQVYGTIFGRFGVSSQISLFDKSQTQRIEVRPGKSIPLSQSGVNVPKAATEMEIEAHLMDYDSLSSDDEIANGKVVFLVKEAGASEMKPISGKFGSVEVNIVWG